MHKVTFVNAFPGNLPAHHQEEVTSIPQKNTIAVFKVGPLVGKLYKITNIVPADDGQNTIAVIVECEARAIVPEEI